MHTDKPQSLSGKDYIVRRLSSRLRHSETVISSVVSHEYSSAALATKYSKEVEISGLGKFLFSNRKANKRKDKLEQIKHNILKSIESVDDKKRRNYEMKLQSLNEEIDYIKNKMEDELDK